MTYSQASSHEKKTDVEIQEEIQRCFSELDRQRIGAAKEIFLKTLSRHEMISSPIIMGELSELCLFFSEIKTAILLLQKAIANKSDEPVFHELLGRCLIKESHYETAKNHFQKAIDINPTLDNSWMHLGLTRIETGELSLALEALQCAITLSPTNSDAHRIIARCYHTMGRTQEFINHALKSIEYNPHTTHLTFLHYAIGRSYSELGENPQAIEHFGKAIESNPQYGIAYHGLAQIKKFTVEDQKFIEMAKQVLEGALATKDRVFINFALGKAFDDLKTWDMAFEHYRQGNTFRKPTRIELPPYEMFENYKKIFTTNKPEKKPPPANESTKPIFIVGMPRSGSTLIEQILSAHPLVATAGELPDIYNISQTIFSSQNQSDFPHQLQQATKTNLCEDLKVNYLNLLQKKQPDAAYIIDKEPSNYKRLGLIHFLFPDSIIIHTTRHPLDTGLSCYFQPFDTIFWSTDLVSIAKEYCFYRDVMDYWKQVLPINKIIDISYEQLLTHPEDTIQNLLESCGLEWHDDCLKFDQRAGTVRTSSLAQVRQPLYQSSRQRWVNYAGHLKPLASGVRPYLNPVDWQACEPARIAQKKSLSFWLRLKSRFK